MYKDECDYEKSIKLSKYITQKYEFVKRFVIGKTKLCRNIFAYTIGRNPKVIYCGAFHGMERITAMMLYRFIDDVCDRCLSDKQFAKTIENDGLIIVPMVNPDGVEISIHGVKSAGLRAEFVSECLIKSDLTFNKWQANSRGVDINHNFNAGFNKVKENERKIGITEPSPTRYGGEYPESERETKALCELCRENQLSLAVALHTQGREIYYDYRENTPKESIMIAEKLSDLSGYFVSHPEGIAVGGGFKDWFIDEFHRPAFTLEIGEGENPLSPEIFDSEYPKVSKMLLYLLDYTINAE